MIAIDEKRWKGVVIEAENLVQAEKMVEKRYESGFIEVGAGDIVDVTFKGDTQPYE